MAQPLPPPPPDVFTRTHSPLGVFLLNRAFLESLSSEMVREMDKRKNTFKSASWRYSFDLRGLDLKEERGKHEKLWALWTDPTYKTTDKSSDLERNVVEARKAVAWSALAPLVTLVDMEPLLCFHMLALTFRPGADPNNNNAGNQEEEEGGGRGWALPQFTSQTLVHESCKTLQSALHLPDALVKASSTGSERFTVNDLFCAYNGTLVLSTSEYTSRWTTVYVRVGSQAFWNCLMRSLPGSAGRNETMPFIEALRVNLPGGASEVYLLVPIRWFAGKLQAIMGEVNRAMHQNDDRVL